MPIKITHIKPEFSDERGFISRIIDQDLYCIKSILYIKRKAGTIGANHYHKKDAHYIYVLSGKVKYAEKNMKNKNSSITSVILNPGDLVLSKPMIAHSTEFLEDTVILAFATEKRSSEEYESDTVRVKFFDKK